MVRNSKYQFNAGDEVGSWLVVQDWSERRHLSHKERQYVLCECRDCNNQSLVNAYNLALGKTGTERKCASCRARGRLGGIWHGMKSRCYLPTNQAYKDYGGRGIGVCDEWKDSFFAFKTWALDSGYEATLNLDRIDNNKGYSPANCRWATYSENNNNRRSNVFVEAFGERKTIAEWSRDSRCAVGQITLGQRLQRGTPPEVAITTKPRKVGYAAATRTRNEYCPAGNSADRNS